MFGHVSTVCLLLEDERVDPASRNAVSSRGREIALAGHIDLVATRPSATPHLQFGETPLHRAACNGHYAVVSVLLADPRVFVAARDEVRGG